MQSAAAANIRQQGFVGGVGAVISFTLARLELRPDLPREFAHADEVIKEIGSRYGIEAVKPLLPTITELLNSRRSQGRNRISVPVSILRVTSVRQLLTRVGSRVISFAVSAIDRQLRAFEMSTGSGFLGILSRVVRAFLPLASGAIGRTIRGTSSRRFLIRGGLQILINGSGFVTMRQTVGSTSIPNFVGIASEGAGEMQRVYSVAYIAYVSQAQAALDEMRMQELAGSET